MRHPFARFTLGLLLLVFIQACNCGKPRVVASACQTDPECPAGYLCENFECVPSATKACDVVTNGNPLLQATPHLVTFGDLDVPEASTIISLSNLGNCTLTLYEAAIATPNGVFTCTECDTGAFPMEIFPDRERTLEVKFLTTAVGTFDDMLSILSDDKEYPEMKIPVHARFLGTPNLAVAPNPVDFGYVAQGRLSRKTLTLSNTGTGTATTTINAIAFDPPATQDYELANLPTLPLTLAPLAIDRSALKTFELQYHPRSTARHSVDLVFSTDHGAIRVPVTGTAETPPKVTVSPARIDLGNVPLGASNSGTITINNAGGAPLHVTYIWGGSNPTTDLWAVPAVVPAVAAGQYTELKPAFTATSIGAVSGMLVLTTDDPTDPSITIPVVANGVPGQGPEVVKVDMVYDNGADGLFDSDMRRMGMVLEHPYGYVCDKQNPNPTNWGNYGTCSWISFPPKDEPQRVVLADAQQDGTWRVMLQYLEDCSSIPTGLLAGLLGISIDALVGYLSGGAINVGGQNIANLISQICLSHDSSAATVKVYVNGTIVKEKTVTLGAKGDSTYAVDLVRTNGHFTAN